MWRVSLRLDLTLRFSIGNLLLDVEKRLMHENCPLVVFRCIIIVIIGIACFYMFLSCSRLGEGQGGSFLLIDA